MKFDRYRAYTAAVATRKAVEVDPDTLKARRVRQEYPVEEVVFEGKADKSDAATFDAGDVTVTRVVFFAGEDEAVVGSIDVNTSGEISVTCPEPEPLPDPDELV